MTSVRPNRFPRPHGMTCILSGIPSETKLSLPRDCVKRGCRLWTEPECEFDRRFGNDDRNRKDDNDNNNGKNIDRGATGWEANADEETSRSFSPGGGVLDGGDDGVAERRSDAKNADAMTNEKSWLSRSGWLEGASWLKDSVRDKLMSIYDAAMENDNRNSNRNGDGVISGHCDGDRCGCEDTMKELKKAVKKIERAKDNGRDASRGAGFCGCKCGRRGASGYADCFSVEDEGGVSRRCGCICSDAGADLDPNWRAPCCGKPPKLCSYFQDLVRDVQSGSTGVTSATPFPGPSCGSTASRVSGGCGGCCESSYERGGCGGSRQRNCGGRSCGDKCDKHCSKYRSKSKDRPHSHRSREKGLERQPSSHHRHVRRRHVTRKVVEKKSKPDHKNANKKRRAKNQGYVESEIFINVGENAKTKKGSNSNKNNNNNSYDGYCDNNNNNDYVGCRKREDCEALKGILKRVDQIVSCHEESRRMQQRHQQLQRHRGSRRWTTPSANDDDDNDDTSFSRWRDKTAWRTDLPREGRGGEGGGGGGKKRDGELNGWSGGDREGEALRGEEAGNQWCGGGGTWIKTGAAGGGGAKEGGGVFEREGTSARGVTRRREEEKEKKVGFERDVRWKAADSEDWIWSSNESSSGFSSGGEEEEEEAEIASAAPLNQNSNNIASSPPPVLHSIVDSPVEGVAKASWVGNYGARAAQFHADELDAQCRLQRLQCKFPRGLAWFFPLTPESVDCTGCNSTPCLCAPCGTCAARPCVCVTEKAVPKNLEDVISLPAAFELKRKDILYNAEQRQRKLQIMSTFRQEANNLDDEASIFFHHNRRHSSRDVLSTNQLEHPFNHQLHLPSGVETIKQKNKQLIQTSALKRQFLEAKKREKEKEKEKYENRIKAELYKEKILHKVLEQRRERKILDN